MCDYKQIHFRAGLEIVALLVTACLPALPEITRVGPAVAAATSDPIADTCSLTDQFTFTDIGTVMDATKLGVEVGSPIADSTAVVLPDGRVRMYFQYLAKDASKGAHYSAISSEGVTFTLESGARMGENEWKDEWWGPHIKAKWLSDGRLRIYKGATARNPGIISYVSSDGLAFTKEDGFRITPTAAGLARLSHLTIVPTSDGKYRGYFSNMPPDSAMLVKSATSSDLLTWTMDSGVRLGPGASVTAVADYSAEQPHALQRAKGCVTVFYFSNRYQNSFVSKPSLRYSTSTDAVTFSTGYSLDLFGNGPDIIRLADGTYLLYYDAGTETAGFPIRVGKLALTQGPPSIHTGGVVNGASFAPGASVAAGSVASVFGTNLASAVAVADRTPLPISLGTTSLQLGGQPAPLFFVSPTQANIQIPWELAGQTEASITAAVAGTAGGAQTVRLAAFAPGIFTTMQTGSGQGAVLIANTDLVAAPAGSIPGRLTRPAARGEALSIFCTGLGPVTNRPPTGAKALSNPLSATTMTPGVTIGGAPARVLFSGLAPDFVGLYQVNVEVPASAATGSAVSVALTIGGASSNTATIAVQ